MKAPPIPAHEKERLDALYTLELLDTPAEERFDRYTRLAMALCDTPISTISLVDSDRQWFKSCHGLGKSETSRDVSFCGHAILEKGVFYIPDARADKRFAENPLVTGEPFIRFYAGCPLFVPGNLSVATLCVIDTRPHELTSTQLMRLRDLADCLQRELLMHLVQRDIARLSASPALAALAAPAKH